MSRIEQNTFRVLAVLVLAAVPVFASPITVSNFSFETLGPLGLPLDACGIGCVYSQAAIPGWTSAGNGTSGQFQPGTQLGDNAYFTVLSDGDTNGYSNGGTISQIVVPTVVLGEVYTLLVDIGKRVDQNFTGSASLLIGGTTSIAATGVTPSGGTWGTYMATYTGLAGDVGKSIAIELDAAGIQGNFDNVRLDGVEAVSGVPEPASFLLIGPALLAIGLRMKRTAKS